MRLRTAIAAFACLAPAWPALAADDATAADDVGATLAPVVVSATLDERDPLEVAASIDAIRIDTAARPALGIHSSDALSGIAGVVARNRQNHAQDEQISIRGFGARSTFGVRGVRMYVDGIPASMPDGAGQVSHFNLDTADRIEVLRGPFSALYGNSSGGVIQLFTAEGTPTPEVRTNAAIAGFGTGRLGLGARGTLGDIGYNVGITHFQADGYREHSRARRESGNAKLIWDIADDRRLTLVANVLDLPDAQDPLGLTWAQFLDDPRGVAPVAFQFDTRKTVFQAQGGAIYEHGIAEHQTVRLMAYGGRRQVEQFLSIPPAAQNSPTSAGGNIDLSGDYRGADLRWSYRHQLAGRPFDISIGLAVDGNDQIRRGYENFLDGRLGVRGRLRRDEDNIVRTFDQYLQATWDVADDWSLSLGARHSRVRFRVDDRYVVGANPDDSGDVEHSATTPVLGLLYRLTERSRLYATVGRGFETPTFAELGYRNDGASGLNLELEPASTRNAELGFKLRFDAGIDTQVALFRADTDDEIAVATNSGGRSTFRNVGSARRQGVELSLAAQPAERVQLRAGYTWLDAMFRSPFLACTGGCTTPGTPVDAGTRIPGVPRSVFFTEIAWGADDGWQVGANASYVSSVQVNDIGSESAPGYPLFALSVGHAWRLPRGDLRAFLRVDNVLDRDHVGSIIVNDGNGRYYEPGPGRSPMLGMQWVWRP
jgi:iron complex outermembrane receptor protein